jgi:hypothetical protein
VLAPVGPAFTGATGVASAGEVCKKRAKNQEQAGGACVGLSDPSL